MSAVSRSVSSTYRLKSPAEAALTLEQSLAIACDAVPGLLNGVLALLPEGILIGGVGAGSSLDRETLIRSATRCTTRRTIAASLAKKSLSFTEFAFVSEEQLVAILHSQHRPRLALIIACTREPNIAWVLSSAHEALRRIEATVDLTEFEV